MTVYRHKNSPHWQYDFQAGGVRYHGSTGCTSKTAAKEYERQRRNEIAGGKQQKQGITVHDALNRYWNAVGCHESNARTTKGQLKRLTLFFGAATFLHDLDRDEIDRYVATRRGQRATNRETLVSNATVNRETELLKRAIKRVPPTLLKPEIDWEGVPLKEPPERVRELSADEEVRLFAKLPADIANVALAALLSGQRRTAIITLLWSKVDLAGARASVRTKGDVWHSFPLSPAMLELVRAQPVVGPFVFTYECERRSPQRGDRPPRIAGERYPFSKQGWARKWRKALEDAGIEDFRFHDLRHTAATRVLRASRNMKAVQKLLGHATIATTARYAHALEDDVRQALIETESRNSPEATRQESPNRLRKQTK